MKKVVPVILFNILMVSNYSCSPSFDFGEESASPPDPASTGEVKATLTFSKTNSRDADTVELNARGNNTFFDRNIYVHNHDTVLRIIGSWGGSSGPWGTGSGAGLTVRLTNISSAGTYPFYTDETPPPPEGYAVCEYSQPFEEFSTLKTRIDPGSVTIVAITTDSVKGYFNALLTFDDYADVSDGCYPITVTSGSFKGHFRTSYYQ